MSDSAIQPVLDLLSSAAGPVFPSAQLLVVDGGATVIDAAVGDCDRDTIFDLASLTKALVTTTLVMRHLDAGRLSLDDELRPGVTVRLALCHASGLPPWRPLLLLGGAPDPKRTIIEAARTEPLDAPPGTRSAYSDLGFILLGDAVERAGNAPLDEQWASLRLCDATYHPDPSRCAPTEGNLRGIVHDENCRAMGGVAGHAGLFGTARAVGEVANALLAAWRASDGSTNESQFIVAPKTLRTFWTPAETPTGSTWCLGWDRPSPGASQAGARWPRTGVGHLGFTGCSLWIDPPRDRYAVLVSNRVFPTRENEAIKRFRPALHDAIVESLEGK
jgi:CubicO group peptidase (beta-lactamase class C family)